MGNKYMHNVYNMGTKVKGLTPLWFEPTICYIWDEHTLSKTWQIALNESYMAKGKQKLNKLVFFCCLMPKNEQFSAISYQ